ncbi:MAG TPA: TonB-dependent receptor [Pyrinomonadaceae bacterium]|jgi:iron complex outermembrane receptor protein
MQRRNHRGSYLSSVLLGIALVCFPSSATAQIHGSLFQAQTDARGATLSGTVTLAEGGTPLHNVIMTVVQLRRSTETQEGGAYSFEQLPPGTYTVLAHMEGFPDVAQSVTVRRGETTTLDFQLRLTGFKEEVTVTATGSEQSTFEAFQSVSTLDSIRIAEASHPSIGEVLDKEPGVAKRSFGPGSSRPVVRGFDGDRVLVVQDGTSTGSLASQSGDHGEPIDVLSLERLEVVKGPATLLYGSNAVGGVVNAVTGHDYAHQGWRGYFTGVAGTTNNQASASGGVEYGRGGWMFWGNASGQRTGDYNTPVGRIENSGARVGNGIAGFGRYSDKSFLSFTYNYDNRRYGIPFASFFESGGTETGSNVDVAARRHNFKFNGGFRNLGGFVDAFRLTLDYSNYNHRELEGEEIGTRLQNNVFTYRGVFEQSKRGHLAGSFGFSGFRRDYETEGEEVLAPPTVQNSFALFTLQTLDFERVKFQLGGRLDHNSYNPTGSLPRSFTGFSGAAGIRVGLWSGGAFVANYTHSYRAPALEELYNNGPHIGNLTFEIGNPLLTRERNDGVDFSLRHASRRLRAEANLYYYNIQDFVFLAPTGAFEDGLIEADYFQADSRFLGTEMTLDLMLHENFTFNLGFDAVDAQLKDGTPLPRIPPMRGRLGFDWRYKNFSLRPEAVFVRDQNEIFPTETRTPGYALYNLHASYTVPAPHYAHIFAVNAFNLGDRLYRNHLSFIKDLAPEIGRGIRFTYTVRFF